MELMMPCLYAFLACIAFSIIYLSLIHIYNLEQWGRGRTMIYITHTVQQLQTMEQIYVLQQGVIVEQGTADRLLQQQNSIFHQMWLLERQQLTNVVS